MARPIPNIVVLVVLGLLVSGSISPATAGAQSGGSMPTLEESIDVRWINIEAVVTESGLPVHGLASEDFELRVNGEIHPIEDFSEVREGVVVTSGAAPEHVGPGSVDGSRNDTAGTDYLVFIDDYFSLRTDRDEVIEALRGELSQLRPQDRMAIVAYDGNGIEMLSTCWTHSVAELEGGLDRALERPAYGLQRWSERRAYTLEARLPEPLRYRRSALPAGLDGGLRAQEQFYARLLQDQVSRTVMATSATLRSFATGPGRRVAILLSGGWPYDIAAFVTNGAAQATTEPGFLAPTELYEPLVTTAGLTGFTLYAVDLPGLQSSPLGVAAPGAAKDLLSPLSTTFARESQLHDTLQHLARETGGRALLNEVRKRALSLTASDTEEYYQLGLAPRRRNDEQTWKIELSVKRPGVRVRHRPSVADLSAQREVGMAIESALLFGELPSPQTFSARVTASPRVGVDLKRAPLVVEIPTSAITLMPERDALVADLELHLASLAKDASVVDGPTIPVRLSSSADETPHTLTYETEVELHPEAERLVVLLHDRTTGTVLLSSVDIQLPAIGGAVAGRGAGPARVPGG